MSKKLSKNKAPKEKLTVRYSDMPFRICLSRKLENNYSFKDLSPSALKDFHTFLDRAMGLPITEVEHKYMRETDTNDIVDGFQVQHFGFTNDAFRIHGYYDEGLLHLVRIDPKHQKHR